MDIQLRHATTNDSLEISRVCASTWQTTYKGLISDHSINTRVRTQDSRAFNIRVDMLDGETYIVALSDNKIVGYISFGESYIEEYSGIAEIYELYVLDDYQKFGIGRMLLMSAMKNLKESGYDDMVVCVLKGNKNIEFYEHYDGKIVREYSRPLYQENIRENIVLFNDISSIVRKFKVKVKGEI